jgi:predicted ATPase
LADAPEVLGRHAPVVLVFDDLQWADASTAKLVTFLSRRREPARLLVIGTYRAEDTLRNNAAAELIGRLAG